MPTIGFRVFWVCWGLVGLAVEIYAAWIRHQAGDTLTEQIRPLLGHPFVWWMGAGLFVWAGLHFFFGRA